MTAFGSSIDGRSYARQGWVADFSRFILCFFSLLYPVFLLPPWSNNAYNKFLLLIGLSVCLTPYLLTWLPGWRFPQPGRQGQLIMVVAATITGLVLLIYWQVLFISLFYLLQALLLAGLLAYGNRSGLATIMPWKGGLAVFLVFVLSTLMSPYPSMAIYGHSNLFTGLVAYLQVWLLWIAVATLMQTETRQLRLVNCIIAGAVVVSIISLLQFFDLDPIPRAAAPPHHWHPGTRATLGHPNWYGAYVVLVLPLAIYRYLRNGRWPWIVSSGIIYASLLTCMTRGSWLAFAAFFIGLLCSRYESKRAGRLAGFFILITLILLPMNNWRLLGRAASFSKEATMMMQGEEKAGSYRIVLWKWTLSQLPQRFFLGSGLDTLSCLDAPGEKPSYGKVHGKAHNNYLDLAIGVGVPGMLLYYFLVIRCLWVRRPGLFPLTLRLILLSYLVQAIFLHDTLQAMPFLWMIMGLALAYQQQPRSASAPVMLQLG